MRILALNPPFPGRYSRQSRSPCVTKSNTLYYPYYLSYATGALEKAGFEVKLVDSVASKLDPDQTVKLAKSFGPDMIVVDTSTPSIYRDVETANALKNTLLQAHVTLTGTHVTNLPEETMKLSGKIDSVCMGEYDNTLVSLATVLEKGKSISTVKGLCYREKGKLKRTGPAVPVKDLDELPFVTDVYRRHLNIKDYFYASITWPEVQILTARGCPYMCSFCNIPMKGSYRKRSVKNVLEELEFIRNELPQVNEVMFEDDTFPAEKKRTLELCGEIRKRKLGFRWSCNARVNTDMETLRTMKEAGCRLACVGFECPDIDVLNNVRKGTTREMQTEFMARTRRAGILVNGCFILGLPGDTRESMKRTIEFSKRLMPNTAQFYPLMVYPGTSAFVQAKEKGSLATEDFSRWLTPDGLHNTVISYPGIRPDEIVEWCNKARREFYTNPKYLVRALLQAVKSPREAVRMIKGGKVLFRHLASRK